MNQEDQEWNAIDHMFIVPPPPPPTNDTKSSASLYTGAESKLGNRVLDEVEKDIFIALSGKGGHSGLMPLKPSVSTWGR